jgi:maltooligosyltrehalose synthase
VCAAELERAGEPLARFGAATRAWCAAETPVPRLGSVGSAARRRQRFMTMRVALAAAAVLMVAAPVYRQHQRAIEMARQDEALLEQVQTEISRSAPEPMQPLEKLVAWNSPSGQSGSSQ